MNLPPAFVVLVVVLAALALGSTALAFVLWRRQRDVTRQVPTWLVRIEDAVRATPRARVVAEVGAELTTPLQELAAALKDLEHSGADAQIVSRARGALQQARSVVDAAARTAPARSSSPQLVELTTALEDVRISHGVWSTWPLHVHLPDGGTAAFADPHALRDVLRAVLRATARRATEGSGVVELVVAQTGGGIAVVSTVRGASAGALPDLALARRAMRVQHGWVHVEELPDAQRIVAWWPSARGSSSS